MSQLVLTALGMAEVLSEDQIGKIVDAFNTVDTDKDGAIASSQLRHVLKLLDENPTDADLQVKKLLIHNRRHFAIFLDDAGHD